MEINGFTLLLTAIGTFVATVFGKDGWNYLTRKKEIDSDIECNEKIRLAKLEFDSKMAIVKEEFSNKITILENKIVTEQLITGQIVTGVDMMLTMFKDEFGEDVKYKNVIAKVQEFINNKSSEVEK